METNWNQLIERYLNGELSAEGKSAFEQQLASNPELQKELELHELTQNLIKRAAVRNMVQQSAKQFHFKNNLIKASVITIITAALALAVYFVMNTSTSQSDRTEQDVLEGSFLESLNKELAFENIDPQYFKFTGENDIFLSESGVLLSITDGSFLLDGKPYQGEAIVQWQEAQQAADIVKAGLSTKSGNKLLETQGMFSLNAFTPDGKKLTLTDEGIYVQVPVDELKKDMMLFNGVQGKNGIDWQNPVELERLPKPKDMAKMDLFPPKYEPKLNELKWFTDKVKRDSLYLSFDEESIPVKDTISTEHIDLFNDIPESKNPIESKHKKPDLAASSQISMLTYNKTQQILYSQQQNNTNLTQMEEGELLFTLKCARCHNLNRDGTGPNLIGVRKRWEEGGAKEGSIYKWVVNSAEVSAYDPYALKTSYSRPTIMARFPEFTGKPELIDAIFDYIDSQPIHAQDNLSKKNHIPPSKVLAIWNKKFNNTNLATQDFEDRMKIIHNTCDERVFDLYAKNLNEPFWKLDERVVKLGYSEFQQFADQKVGKLNISDAHQKNIAAFYDQAIKTIREKGKNAMLAALKKDQEWDESVAKKREQEVYRRGSRDAMNDEEEANYNLKYLSKQLGTTLGFALTSETFPSHYPKLKYKGSRSKSKKVKNANLPIVVNIDRLTTDLLSSRQSITVNMIDKSKSTKLVYSPFSVKVDSYKKYDRMYFYLMPNALNSFERLDFTNGDLSYPLNGAFGYDAVIVGINEDGYFIHETKNLKPINIGTVKLMQVSEAEFNRRINAMNSGRNVHRPIEIQTEIEWLFEEKANYKVQKQRRENASFRAIIRPAIYSCQFDNAAAITDKSNENQKKSDGGSKSTNSREPVPTDQASFPGGRAALIQFINQRLKFPQSAIDNNIKGKVNLKFTISETGKVSNVTVVKGLAGCPECDEEAKRVVLGLPDWIPAKNGSQNVSSSMYLPISFSAK